MGRACRMFGTETTQMGYEKDAVRGRSGCPTHTLASRNRHGVPGRAEGGHRCGAGRVGRNLQKDVLDLPVPNIFPDNEEHVGHFRPAPTAFFFIGSGLTSEAECRRWDDILREENTLKKKYLTHPIVSDCVYTFTLRHGLPLLTEAALAHMRGKVFVDGGAFVGDSSLVFLDYEPGEVWAFEPSSNNRSVFRTRCNAIKCP